MRVKGTTVEGILRDNSITPTTEACAAYRLGEARTIAELNFKPAEEGLASANALIDDLEHEISVLRARLREIGLLAGRRVV